jgi:hypothetical protein
MVDLKFNNSPPKEMDCSIIHHLKSNNHLKSPPKIQICGFLTLRLPRPLGSIDFRSPGRRQKMIYHQWGFIYIYYIYN